MNRTTGSAAPTAVRHRVTAVLFFMSLLLYLDRFCVSFAEIYIKQDLQLSEFAISLLFSAFFLTYALGQTISGWMGDRFGGRTMLTLYIVAWSLFTGLLGLANGLAMVVVLRLGLGFAQAGAYPTAATLVAKWAPLTRRGMASSIVALGGRTGGVLALFGTGYVILYFAPIEVPSTLTARDILGASRLCHEIRYGNLPLDQDARQEGLPTGIGRRLLAGFPADLRGWVEEEGLRYRSHQIAAARAAESGASLPPPLTRNDPVRGSELAEALNAVLRQPGYFSADELSEVKLEHEAYRLLRRDPSVLSQSESERLNRLALEAIYPASIKKVYGAGWRKMMLLYGVLGLPVALVFWSVCRDSPRRHPRCNAAELALIERGRAATEATQIVGAIPLADLVASRSMWFNGAMQFFTNVGWVFLATYAPRYFVDVHSAPVALRTWMTAIPAVAACAGLFLGGVMTDPAVRWWGPRWGRSIPIAATRIAAGGAYLFCLLDPSPWAAVLVLSVTSLMSDFGIPAIWALQQDVGGRYAGSVLGWGNMWGNFGAVVGPTMIGWIIGTSANWNVVFSLCAAAFALAGLAALGIDATRPVVRDRVGVVPVAGGSTIP